MRNLLEESLAISTTAYYLKEDGTKSDTPCYDFIRVKIPLKDGLDRYYSIYRSSHVGRTDLAYKPSHSISGYTYNENADYWMREGSRRTIFYKDDASFEKAIKAIQKKLKTV